MSNLQSFKIMTSKSMKPQAAKPVSEEEKRLQIVRFLSQKREQFATNILYNLAQGDPAAKADTLVDKAVEMADKLMQKLYPMEREEGK